jgi:hypothetical protein
VFAPERICVREPGLKDVVLKIHNERNGGYMSRLSKMASLAFLVLATGTVAFAQFSTEVGPDFLKTARPLHAPDRLQKDSNLNFSLENGPGIPGVDALTNFTGQFNGIGVDGSPQDVWLYSMVGNRPER